MKKPDDLRAALERWLGGSQTEEDRHFLQRAFLRGTVLHSPAEHSMTAGEDGLGSIIITEAKAPVRLALSNEAFERLRGGLLPSPRGIPPPFPDLIFLGREQALQDVKDILGSSVGGSSRPQLVAVRGWPGVGKTTLVSFLARDPQIARAFPDGVLWASLDQKPALMSILAGWGRALGKNLLHIATPEKAVEGIAAELEGKRMLLIVDDVWDAAHGTLFLKARAKGCGLIFTTRLPEVAAALAQTDRLVYNLPVLAEDDALKLLRILAPTVVDGHPDECRLFVRRVECLPLAIHVGGRLLQEEQQNGWGVAELIKQIQDAAKIIQARAPADRAENGQIPTVEALLQKSTDVLDEVTRECFASLAPFAPKPATFNLDAMKYVWRLEDPRPIVRTLVARGLLEPTGKGRFQMHALLVAHAKSLCTE
jgi:hypothetical protein